MEEMEEAEVEEALTIHLYSSDQQDIQEADSVDSAEEVPSVADSVDSEAAPSEVAVREESGKLPKICHYPRGSEFSRAEKCPVPEFW